ncbi:MAG: hypothetical protein WAX77_06815 [Methylococcaceae bacterium]
MSNTVLFIDANIGDYQTLLTIKQTTKKLSVSFYDYVHDRVYYFFV